MKSTSLSRARVGLTLAAASLLLANVRASTVSLGRPELASPIDDLQELVLPPRAGEAFEIELLLEGRHAVIDLTPYSVRSPRFHVVASADGVWQPGRTPPSSTYRGTVAGRPDVRIAASLLEDGLHALLIVHGEETSWSLEPALPGPRSDPARVHRLRRVVQSGSGVCAGAIAPPLGAGAGSQSSGGSGPSNGAGQEQLVPTASSLTTVKVCELGCDADYEFYAFHGSSVITTVDAIESVVNFSSLIYEQEVGVTYSINAVLVRTSEPDPYPTHTGTYYQIANYALQDLQTEWNTNQTAIARDTVHLFTGKLPIGYLGIANVGTMCTTSTAYGVSFAAPQDFATQAVVFSHEIGHNWGACHCDQTGCGSGPSGCDIMCSGIGHCDGQPILGPFSGPQIAGYVASATCLGTGSGSVAPQLSTISPGQVDVLGGETITLGGVDLDKVTQINSNGTLLDIRAFTIVDNHTLHYSAPAGTAFGPVGVRVSGPGGQSSVQRFGYVATAPARILCEIEGTFFPNDVVTWRFGSLPGYTAQVLRSSDSSTTTINGFTVLANGAQVQSGALDALGLGTYVHTIAPSETGQSFWMQVVFYSGTTVVGTSNILLQQVV